MDKLNGQSFHNIQNNIEKMKELFPEICIENKINFTKLQLLLGEQIEIEKECYDFTWKGKAAAIQLAEQQTTATLRPNIESSLDWEKTKNLYIEGDNLEVLRILQNSYRNQVKMIYIDPPYNTGNDFVYKDNFRNNIKNYKEKMNESLKSNVSTSARYHTEWLNMMYPRLKIARNLLSEDGIIFISIDDNEIDNLKRICNEIFGEENFVTTIVVKMSEPTGVKMTHVKKNIPKLKEYVLCYKKRNITFEKICIPKHTWDNEYKTIITNVSKEEIEELKSIRDNEERTEEDIKRSDAILANLQMVSVSEYAHKKNVNKTEFESFLFTNAWRIIRTVSMTGNGKNIADEKKRANKNRAFVITTPNKKLYFINNHYNSEVDYPRIKILFADDYLTVHPCDLWTDIKTTGLDNEGFVDYRNGKKPLKLINRLLSMVALNDNDIVMDFFSGSGTFGEAVVRYNLENNQSIRYILVQIDEDLIQSHEKFMGVAKKDAENLISYLKSVGRKPLLSELGKERMTRVNKELKNNTNDDLGFKSFKLDTTNLVLWDEVASNMEKPPLDKIGPVKKGRSEEDAVYEILIKYGMDLSLPVERLLLADRIVYSVDGGSLFICLEKELTLEQIDILSNEKPRCIIFYENCFTNDTVRSNAQQLLKHSGVEDIRVI
ncbi:site-specific DNA-methyltransferase [Viridibacillus sp. YIM B01967]|uniref:Site-specific DNA-methyltransferase n=1 Tax=Viridibacillus soli TaxID=2798301 RepID=A0ABS1HBM9_9BACL|nr:site-specific DNA-methyltransferase [Viridibacillus soli]MBK3496861.1 site-specific DNA-methyltransferase [Viridibacillus soli]